MTTPAPAKPAPPKPAPKKVDPFSAAFAGAGIDHAKFLAGAVLMAGKPDHDVDVFLNEHVYGRERPFFRALVRALSGGA